MHRREMCSITNLLVLLVMYSNMAYSAENRDKEIEFVIDFIVTLRSPKSILENLCWEKESLRDFKKRSWSHNIRFRSLLRDDNIFQQLYHPYFYTIVVSLECDFDLILKKALETTLIKHPNVWIVFGKFSKLKNLNYYIPISSFFVVPFNDKFGNYMQIKTIYKTNKNMTEYIEKSIGSWSNTSHTHNLSAINLIRDRTNFRKMPLRVSYVVTNNSTFAHMTDYRDKHLDNLTKINYILYYFICDLLNATQIRVMAKTWGFEDKNTTFSHGMFEDLVLGRSDVAGTVSFTPASRVKYFKYIFAPIKDFSPRFVFRAPSLAYYTNIFMLPFDKMVWLTIVVLLVICSLLVYIVFNWESKEQAFSQEFKENEEISPSVLDILMMQIAIMCQMDFFHEPKSVSGKIITFAVLITFTFIYTAFSARIVLLLQSNTNKINDVYGLLEANFDFGVESQPYNVYYFEGPSDRADENLRKIIYENKIKKPGRERFLSAAEGMKLVRDTHFAFHVDQTIANYLIDRTFSNVQKCSLRIVETIYKADVPHLAVPRNSPYIEFFIVSFRRLAETGIHNREYRRCFTKKPSCEGTGNFFVSVGLIESSFSFFVFIWGFCLSIIILILENVTHSYLKIRCAL